MNAQQFLAEFGHIANAPGGVARLRELVYQFAVTGKLTLQIEEDGSAADVLTNVARIRKQLIAEKKFKRSPKLESAPLVPPMIDLPPNWRWSRLLDLGEINPRNRVEEDSETVVMATFVPMAAVSELHSIAIAGDVRPWSKISKGYTHFANGDVLLAKITPCFENGKSAVVHGLEHNIGSGSTEFHVFRPISEDINPAYVYLFVRSPLFRVKGEASMTGTAGQKRLPTDYFALCAMPLPPTEEQSRIVAKVDELMALCDQLEAQQQKRRTLQNHLRQATLQAVAASQSPHELQDNWQRLHANFGQLFSAPEDVEELRKLLSELAIYGALDASDLPTHTSVLDSYLESLARIKSGKRFAKINQVNKELSLPSGWRWVLLEELLAGSESGWSPKCEAEQRRGDEWGVLKVSAVTWGEFKADENKRLPLSLEARPECEVKPGDFMLSRANTAELVARSVIAPEDCPRKLLMSDKIVRLSFLDDRLKPWVNLVNNSEYARTYYKERATGTSDSMRNVSRQVIHELPIPLPPLEVQERIFKSLADLLAICDSLENKSKIRLDLAKNLAEASVATLTGIAIEQEEEPMKAPQTELVAPVRLGTSPDVKAQAPLATILARHNGEMSAKDLWQRFGGEIDAFYAQLKTEVAHGWLLEPEVAEMYEKASS
jgi:type I restriction enzyme S subunit